MVKLSAANTFALLACIGLAGVRAEAEEFKPTSIKGFFIEQFQQGLGRWSPSKATKTERGDEVFSYVGQWSVEEPTVFPGLKGDTGLVAKSKAAHHAVSVPFDTPLDPKGKTLVVQYEVKLQKGLDCGGAYIKLLTDSEKGIQAEEFSDKTPYTIMFGPDKCGGDQKVHFIFRHTHPITGEIEEKHLVAPPNPKTSPVSALYTLIVRPDQTYEIKINNESAKRGYLLEDFSPSVNPPKEIDDPSDVKPADWVDTPKISDPDATKPDDWDENAPEYIEDAEALIPDGWLVDETTTVPDPTAEKPEEWSDEDDGDWEPPTIPNPKCATAPGCGPWKRPQIPNPAYKGKWFAPLIDNPAYKGPWAPRKIPNPHYYEDLTPADFNLIGGLGFELWTMTEDILFDNIYVGDSEEDAALFAAETFLVKKAVEDALEKAAAPEEKKDAIPDVSKDPIEFAKYKVNEFLQVAQQDPFEAILSQPYTAAGLLVGISGIAGLFLLLVSILLPSGSSKSKAPSPVKKTDAVSPDDAADEASKAAPIAEKKVEEKGIKTRSAAKTKVDNEE